MSRLIRWIFNIVLILCLIAVLTLWFALTPLLESLLSKKLHSDVSIESVHLGWKKLCIKNMRVKNSSTSLFPYALETNSILIQMNPLKLFKENIHIERIKIENPSIIVELYTPDGKQNNWAPLLKEEQSPVHSSSSVIIDRLNIVNLQIELIPYLHKKAISLPPIPYLEFNGLGRTEQLSLGQVAKEILVKILEIVRSKQNLNALLDQIIPLPSNVIDQLDTTTLDTMKNNVKESVEAIKHKAEEIQKYLQNLFSK